MKIGKTFSRPFLLISYHVLNNFCAMLGFVYGAENNKSLKLFIDDINLPRKDLCGKQSVNQLLRQLLDRNVIFSDNKHYKQKLIEGFHVIAAMNSSSLLCRSKKNEISRLMVNFLINSVFISRVSSDLIIQ